MIDYICPQCDRLESLPKEPEGDTEKPFFCRRDEHDEPVQMEEL